MSSSFGCGLSASSSAPQLRRKGGPGSSARGSPSKSLELPMITANCWKPETLSFEDLYAHARQRICRRSAEERQGGVVTSGSMSKVANKLPVVPWKPAIKSANVAHSAVQRGVTSRSVLQPLEGLMEPMLDASMEGENLEWLESVNHAVLDVSPRQKVRKSSKTSRPGSKQATGNGLLSPERGTRDGSTSPSQRRRCSVSKQANKEETVVLGVAAQGGPSPSKEPPRSARDEPDELESEEETWNSGESEEQERLEELPSWRPAFNRFKAPGSKEVHIDELKDILQHLGHGLTLEDHFMPVFKEVTAYDYFDYEEFIVFMNKYRNWELSKIRETFDAFDIDKSSEISIQELRPLLSSLGLVPYHATVREALTESDSNSNASLDFEETRKFLNIYTEKQGFSKAQVSELRDHFENFSFVPALPTQEDFAAGAPGGRRPGVNVNNGRLSAWKKNIVPGASLVAFEDIQEVLCLAFGPQQAEFTQEIVDRYKRNADNQSCEGLSFYEFLVIARRIRESQREWLKKDNPNIVEKLGDTRRRSGANNADASPEAPSDDGLPEEKSSSDEIVGPRPDTAHQLFEDADEDGSGSVSILELKKLLNKQGYTALKQVITEICLELVEGWDRDYELDFNEFFDFIMIYHQREGFLKAEVEAFKRVFLEHDEDNSGEVSTLELSKLLRYLGYRHTNAEVHGYVVQADVNMSGQLDWREFLQLMRKFKENACSEALKVFDEYADTVVVQGREERCMKGKHLNEALKKLGHSYVRNPFLDGFKHFGADDFIGILDATRVDFVERERGKAGFTETELEYFFGIFQKHDKNHNGWLGPVELEEALTLFGWAPTSRQEQSALVAKIATAHARARGAGVETGVKEGAADMTGKTTFWVLVQLLRLLHDENDRREERELTQLCEELHFSQAEVDQFHHIYRQYARPNPQFITGLQRKVSPTLLAGDSCRSLIRSLGVHVSERDETFRQKLASLDKSGKPDHPSLEFWPFLRLMRWLLDTNFGGINDSVARKMKSKGSEKTGESDNS